MATLARTAFLGSGRTITRQCVASSSRLVRTYATESTVTASEIYGTSSKSPEGAIMKKYTGKGFPAIPGLRHLVQPYHPHLYSGAPLRALTTPLRRKGGRNDTGQVVNRAVGGGHKRRLRIVDFHRHEGGEHDVVRIEYDPGRSAHIALIKRRGGVDAGVAEVDADAGAVLAEAEELEGTYTAEERRRARDEVRGGWSYILAPEGLRAGDVVTSYRSGLPSDLVEGWDQSMSASTSNATAAEGVDTDPEAPQTVDNPSNTASARALGLLRTMTLKPGNVLPLYLLPAGTIIHNISLRTDGRMQLCRSAGSYAQIIAHHGPKGNALGGAEILNMGGDVRPDGTRSKARGSVLVKLQSGEVRRIEPGCVATVGTVSK